MGRQECSILPINVTPDGNAKTVCAGYYKYGVQTLLTGNYGTTGTIVLEIWDNPDREDMEERV